MMREMMMISYGIHYEMCDFDAGKYIYVFLPSLIGFFNPLYLFSLYISRLRGQEVTIKGVFKHRTSTTPLAEQ